MKTVIHFIIFQILDQAPIFLGIIALVGLLVQKKKFSDIFDGVIKTIVGLIILSLGATAISDSIGPVIGLLNNVVKVKGVMPMNEAAFGVSMLKIANQVVLTFIIGFLIHLALVFILPWKNFKNVYLTAHMMLYLSVFLNLSLGSVLGIKGTSLVIVSAIFAAIYWTFTPAIPRVLGRKFVGDDFTLGHAQQFGALIGAGIGKLFGKPEENDSDKIKLPGGLYLFQDITLALAIIIPILYIIIGLIVGQSNVSTLSKDQNWIIWLIMQSLYFVAGVSVMLVGVRMFLNSIIPAFKGISEKIIPNSIAALDCPVYYPYSSSGAMIGFLGSIPASIVVTLILIAFKSPIVVFPSPIILFFDGCTVGVFGNKYGGWKGALVGGFVSSFIAHLGVAALYPMMGMLYGSGVMFSNIDYAVFWLPILWILKLLRPVFGI
ncbi:PTS ascorbate transporter subunit IIC [Acidilutibacter cellobiosedens]|jgi:PTS system ascorbate-specific IIC component|uniref:Ascorbate-specific PTS system EIIC component n=1 Tax=Acidilutibacter cellobiosedens TaxID=2507161 RepID=A0A410QAR9_9FIRM|nr:PTS transporter subunit IIC [Acidilutibacter cellobiosedens]QAT61093.1 PTS ascorbate transporter subunit IIC [Acidilutibacter cellobiosedens]